MYLLRVILPGLLLGAAAPSWADSVATGSTQAAAGTTTTATTTTTAGASTTSTIPAKSVPSRPPAKRDSFNDLVRNLVAAHEVMPLKAVLEVARKASIGEVVSIKLHRQKNRWIYHVRLLKPDGRREELDIDGKTLKILERK